LRNVNVDDVSFYEHLRQMLADRIGFFWFVFLALWGGTASYVARMKKRALPFSLMELIGEWAISGFSGLITALVCVNLEMSFELTAASAGIAGHMGGRAIGMIEHYITDRFKPRP
jgi:hypothetical protein